MANDEQRRFRFANSRSNFRSAAQQQLRHLGVIDNRFAIFPNLTSRPPRLAAAQLQFAWDYRLREIAFANEIRDHIDLPNLAVVKAKQSVAQARLLFPKTGGDFTIESACPQGSGLGQARRARVRIDG